MREVSLVEREQFSQEFERVKRMVRLNRLIQLVLLALAVAYGDELWVRAALIIPAYLSHWPVTILLALSELRRNP